MILSRTFLTAFLLATAAAVASTLESSSPSDSLSPAELRERAAEFFPGWRTVPCTR